MDLRPIVMIIGIMLVVLAVGMCFPAAVDVFSGNPDWQVFVAAAGMTGFIGVAMALTCRTRMSRFSIRQAFVLTACSWIVITVFAALPFVFSDLGLSFTDAFFEAMSGITTTGSTVITGLDSAPPGILLWRAILQWLGGIGIVVVAINVLPALRVGGMQLFRMEASSDRSDKALPRIAQITGAIAAIYMTLTVVWAGAYALAGMSGFEAIAHAMTTIATGGFSTSDGSVGHFDSALIDAIAVTGMIVGGLPFLFYLRLLRGDATSLTRDSQVLWFLGLVVLLVAVATGWLWMNLGMDLSESFRYGAFNTISIITGTGYATTDYFLWGSFAVPIFFFIMFVGGCAGSTTCGIKIFRFQILYSAARAQLHHLVQPSGVFIPYYNRQPVSEEVIVSVLSFFFVFGLSFSLLAIGLGMVGLDFLTAISSAATAISNVGPALGPIVGPAGTFQPLPDTAKWLMAGGMLLGRLELFPIIVLFTRTFWRE